MWKKIFPAFLCASFALPLSAQNAAQVAADFEARRAELDALHKTDTLSRTVMSAECREAMQFLYAYMPWPDVADYPVAYHLAQTRSAIRARSEMPWGKNVPQREWMHFVLPVRVNNENLDTFRTARYDELRERVKNLTMREAVLEVNHWCHEYVTYKPSDSRTSSPLASMKTATGRCGEESTFTVAALRAVGIPARQVYTPRWAHTDDNHAWVEAWIDGEWCFLGACEPEPVTNLGWFNQPASRGMLMHTKVFGNYDGPEDVIDRTLCFTEINVTANYAQTARTVIRVTDAAGKPVAGARVDFKIYNYGELYTVQSSLTAEDGRTSIVTGLGDMVAWASAGERYGFAQFTAGKGGEQELRLTHKAGETYVEELTLVPPVGQPNIPEVSAQARAENNRRFAHEDSIRTAYTRTFADSAATAKLCAEVALNFARVFPLAKKACGNWRELFSLLRTYPSEATLDLLETLSDKDLRDFSPATLSAFVKPALAASAKEDAALSPSQRSFKYKYVYCPRVANEMLTAWQDFFSAHAAELKEINAADPVRLAEWINANVALNPDRNPLNYTLSPAGAYAGRRADARNMGILFVAMCRAQGIPARIDEVTGKVQYVLAPTAAAMPDEASAQWQTVRFGKGGEEAAAPSAATAATLRLDYTPREYMENPIYYTHFSLSRLVDGTARLQNYPEEETWQSIFKNGAQVDAGDYLLTSGTRLADGTVLARLVVFGVKAGETAEQTLVMRKDEQAVQVIGNFNAENLYFDVTEGKMKSILSTTGRGYYVTGLIRANHEPTNHILHDIEKLRSELESWGRPILLLFPNHDEYARFLKNSAEFTNLPSTLTFGVDADGAVQADLFGSGLTKSRELPLVVIADTFNRLVFASQGYTIGLGERIKNVTGKIK